MNIRLLTIGKTDNKSLQTLIDDYTKRLSFYVKFDLEIIPDIKNVKNLSEAQQKEKEGELILSKITPTDHLILLDENGNVITSENLKVHPRMKELYKFFKFNGKVIDIKDYEEKNLDIFSRKILKMICKGETGWEELLPEGTAEVIKKEKLFSYACELDLKEPEGIK